nr:FeoA family protein [Maliibacterium massiliense]
MPLVIAPVGEEQSIKRIAGRDKTRRYLESLGFVAGGKGTGGSVLGGNMIVHVKDARIAIDRNMAARGMV